MQSLPRLIKVLNVLGKYRLVEFLENVDNVFVLRTFLKCYGLVWRLSDTGNGEDKNVRLRKALEELGPIYIKFGQLLSTRRDFIDDDLANELQLLQDQVPPFTEPSVELLIENSLGVKSSEIFSSLESAALASASIAQVHAATLYNGDEVVVKVIRPGIEKTITADMKLLKRAAALIENNSGLGKRLRTIEVVADYEKIIHDELDLQAEAANTTQLKRNFDNSELLYVPKVHWDFTRNNIMVMERIYGIPVGDVERLKDHGINFKALAERGVEIFFTQVFDHSFFHADMHPGNIFVDPGNPESPQYIAIDCAIIGSLSKDDQQYLARNLLAIFKRDYRKVAVLHIECGWVPAHTKVHEFESAIRSVCEPIFEKPLKDISFGQLLLQLFRTAGRFDMEVQPSLVLLQKTLLNVEGLGRQLYPELDLWQTALPFLERWNSKRLNPLSLLERLQENIPDWIDQLPDLPRLLLESATDARQLAAINQQLEQQRQLQQRQILNQRKRSRFTAVIAFIAAAITSLPTVQNGLDENALVPILLASLGLILLSFRQ